LTVDSQQVERLLQDYLVEALDLRFTFTIPPPGAGPEVVMNSLIETRQRLDRVEELLVRTLRIRARARRAATAATASADDHWNRAVRRVATSSVRQGPEFQGPRERYAEADLSTLEHRHEARLAEALAGHCDETYDAIRTMHRGLDGLRQDHVTILRSQQFATHLEQ
jgi:hypothetical protein